MNIYCRLYDTYIMWLIIIYCIPVGPVHIKRWPPGNMKCERLLVLLFFLLFCLYAVSCIKTSRVKAASVIQSFYAKFTELRTFNRAVIERARTQGRLASMFGRRRHFPYISSSNLGLRAQAQRQAFNFLIQGGQKAVVCAPSAECILNAWGPVNSPPSSYLY